MKKILKCTTPCSVWEQEASRAEMMVKAFCLEVAALCQDIWASCIYEEACIQDHQVDHQEEEEDHR
jgi:hypothetical protein